MTRFVHLAYFLCITESSSPRSPDRLGLLKSRLAGCIAHHDKVLDGLGLGTGVSLGVRGAGIGLRGAGIGVCLDDIFVLFCSCS